MVAGKEGNYTSKQPEDQKGNRTSLGLYHTQTLCPMDQERYLKQSALVDHGLKEQ